jgi:enamine deaminase RidA (YjgF/YER057c/UK114 family)
MTRLSIEIEGFRHKNPVPNACRIGDLLISGPIAGTEPDGSLPASLEAQCTNIFAHVRSIMAKAGGSTDDVIKMTVWLRDPTDREALNREWRSMFPDPSSRPARHVLPIIGENPTLIHCDIMAVFHGG